MAKKELKDEMKSELKQDMTLEEARAYRASLYKPQKRVLSEQEKRDLFRMFWSRSRKGYGNKNSKGLEQILWVHLQATGNDEPEKFEAGIKHFGLKKVS